jgi:lysophospholipase L1-like esterase
VLANAKSIPLDPKTNAPSKITAVRVGKWWYWRDYPAQQFAIDDLRLEPEIALDNNDYRPTDAPLARTLAKLKAGQPVTIVTMGDSLTDYRHWANKPANWPTLLKEALAKEHKSEVTIVNPAIGGTELRQNLVLIPRWLATTPAPDLVTICFGFNDFSSGMKGEMFEATQQDAIDRVRRATGGKSDVLVITTCPAAPRWNDMAELAEACRKAAAAKNAGLADTYAAFHLAGKENPEKLFVNDKVHLSPDGHKVFAETVLSAIANGGKPAK